MKKTFYSAAGSATLLALSAGSAFAQSINVTRPSFVPAVNLGSVISAVIGMALVVAAVLALLYLILGGIQWITSGGDKQGLEAARNKITAAIVGLIIVASTWAIMLLLGQFVGFNLFQSGGIDLPTIENPDRGGSGGAPGAAVSN